MKKLTLLLVLILYGLISFAQRQSLREVLSATNQQAGMRIIPPKDAVQSPPFFSEDFGSGIPGAWTNIDNTGNNVLWRYTTTGALNLSVPVDAQLNPNGTSALNGYVILDSDSAGSAFTENTDLTTSAINCTGHNSVHLTFNQYFAQFGSSTGVVKVSNDNISWVDVHNAETGLIQDSGTANPYYVDIDISSTAANQQTVYIRFNYKGAFDYWWMVDDIELYEPSATDLAAYSTEKLNTEYTKIPLTQATTLIISGEIKNVGLNATSGGTALLELVNIGNGLSDFSETVNLGALPPGGLQTVVPSSAFAPLTAGLYKSRVTVSLAGDGNAGNNVIESSPLEISDSIYQKDDEIITGVIPIGFGSGEDGTAGQNFMINEAGDLTSITFFLKDTFSFGVSGTPLYFTIHPQASNLVAPDATTLIAITDTLLLFNGMIPPGGTYYTLHIQGGSVHLNAGLYFIGFHEVDSLIPMGYSDNIFTAGSVWAYANSANWFKPEDFGFYFSYLIRVNMGMLPDGMNEPLIPDRPIVFPNPSTGIFHFINFRPEEKYVITVVDVMGNRVESSGIKVGIGLVDLSNLPEGIYSVILKSENSSSVQKICIIH